MKIRIPVIVKDPEVSEYKDVAPTELIEVEEDSFLDGPVSPRVAVLDFDPTTGQLAVSARFVAPATRAGEGSYEIPFPIQRGDQKVDHVAEKSREVVHAKHAVRVERAEAKAGGEQ